MENIFGEDDNKKLMEYVMKENNYEYTSLHIAVQKGNETIVKLLLNIFGERKKQKLIQYLMKQTETPLHVASKNGNEKIVKLLLDIFGNILQKTFL